jgi:hypothetical protein
MHLQQDSPTVDLGPIRSPQRTLTGAFFPPFPFSPYSSSPKYGAQSFIDTALGFSASYL